MTKSLALATAALLTLGASSALAQSISPSTAVNPAQPAPATAPQDPARGTTDDATMPAASATASGANASVTAGMAVMDNTGLTIGQVTEVKADAAGKKTATIKMGADTFAVETDRLAVMGKNAQVNATQAEIKTMLGKK